jgi:hypothetical protein
LAGRAYSHTIERESGLAPEYNPRPETATVPLAAAQEPCAERIARQTVFNGSINNRKDGTMRKFLISAAAIAALAVAPSAAMAQAATGTGVAVGAGTGFLIGGPPGAIVGGIIGGSVGATAEPRVYVDERVYVEPRTRVKARARTGTRVYAQQPQQVCWRDVWNRTFCEYR